MKNQDKTKTQLIQEIAQLEKKVAELENTERKLQEHKNRFRLFSETAFEGIILSKDGVLLDCNDQYLSMVGYKRDDLIGTSTIKVVAPESQEDVNKILQRNQTKPHKVFILHQSGRKIHAEITTRTFEMDGETLRATAIRDITEQERMQEALRVSQNKFVAAFYASPDSININRLSDGLYLEINQGFTNITGYTPEDIVGKTSLELDIWADPKKRAALVQGLLENGEVNNMEAIFKMKNGDCRTGLMSAKIMDCAEEPCILSVTRDVTEWKESQQKIELLNQELLSAYDETLEGWSRALNLRDADTDGHSKRVVDGTVKLAQKIGFPNEELVYLRRGAILHDIGKMGIPDHILLKEGPLSGEERHIMQSHPLLAYQMLSTIPFLKQSLDIPYCHHEKWDGSGYPRGLKGEEIPLSARIFSVIDIFDALTSDRPYRPAWKKAQALTFIKKNTGSHFDPEITSHFFDIAQSII